MSTLRVTNIRDLSGTGGLYLNAGTISAQGTLTVSNLVINGTISGSNTQYLPAQSGNNAKYLTTDGTNASWVGLNVDGGGPVSMQFFTSSGTWNRPTNIKYIHVRCQAGGGGASGHGESVVLVVIQKLLLMLELYHLFRYQLVVEVVELITSDLVVMVVLHLSVLIVQQVVDTVLTTKTHTLVV